MTNIYKNVTGTIVGAGFKLSLIQENRFQPARLRGFSNYTRGTLIQRNATISWLRFRKTKPTLERMSETKEPSAQHIRICRSMCFLIHQEDQAQERVQNYKINTKLGVEVQSSNLNLPIISSFNRWRVTACHLHGQEPHGNTHCCCHWKKNSGSTTVWNPDLHLGSSATICPTSGIRYIVTIWLTR